jgi:hypothetical protein
MEGWKSPKRAVIATAAGGLFFPQREALGFSSREQTPQLAQRIVHAAAETRSFERAAIALNEIAGCEVSAKTIERVAHEVGEELAVLRDQGNGALVKFTEAPPALAVVQCDGGRIRTREANQAPGVTGQAWRETKNACLVRMSITVSQVDPQPELPITFRNPVKIAELAEKEPLSGISAPVSDTKKDDMDGEDWRPKRLVRTCLSSMACSSEFGKQMKQEATQRRFFEAGARAFLGDGLPWNWSIHKEHFQNFVPILDFIHVLSYIYSASVSLHADTSRVWLCYEGFATACWQGRVGDVIQVLSEWLKQQGITDATKLESNDPRQAVIDAVRYLGNNRDRMNYPAYRRAGLPIVSALMESMVKEINYRVKGTEMFWNDPCGAEAILQIRAAALSDDGRLSTYLAQRPGRATVRPVPTAIAG